MKHIKGKKLYRSQTDKVWAGVCGGLGEYFEIDPLLIRVVFMILVIISGVWPALGIYIIIMLIVPYKPDSHIRDAEVVSE